ncbi:beta-1,3-galactosyltransferase brn-like [Teleopsis dalmanni]|uniref:beta-1,3-galactosyltransferase brn-like n=1 Tax=Teleopsis dalmanni TaxID=139649 RepID=UPI0018CD36A4|nr:beta-1,3-galactosyltransferase brn-like [Teleopsis dalmanni]XP_037955225.1 beta-1,3-galactosyltransferase brn-like [Teleopsis dalmanni]
MSILCRQHSIMNSKRFAIKFLLLVIFVLVLDYVGLFKILCELEYELLFNYPSGGFEKTIGNDTIQFRNENPTNFYNYSFTHNPKQTCNISPFITFLIKSAPGNIKQRKAIRRTWGFEERFSDVIVRRIFLIGLTTNSLQAEINVEAKNYNDIVQADFIDAYFNNTIKTMMGMRWAKEHCHSQYYMFVDDDYYVSLKNVLQFCRNNANINKGYASINTIDQNELVEYLYAGYVIQSKPQRQKFSKWYISLEEYPFNKWPPYVTAGAFILSQNTLKKLYDTSLYTKHFRFDDIYLAIVALKSGIKLTHCQEFYFHKPTSAEKYRNLIASHEFSDPSELEEVWNKMRSAGYA